MNSVLKGNFQTEKKVEAATEKTETSAEKFEKDIKKKIGGSIAYVAKQKVRWDLQE